MIPRDLAPSLAALAEMYPVVAVTGPRQSGKTTLCRATFPEHPYVSLEAEDRRNYATDDPRGFLAEYRTGVVLDEVQRAPHLLGYVQEMVDADPRPGRFVLTGSQHFALSAQISQSLAGRVGLTQLLPPSLPELRRFAHAPTDLLTTLWSGSYPRIYDRSIPADQWLRDYFSTYIQRDVRQVLNVGDLATFTNFVRLLAGSTSRELNLSRLGADTGVSYHTIRAWLSVLETSYLVTRVLPFHANVRKQLVKAPKIAFFDSGLVCHLLGIRSPDELRHHPLRGEIFETWVTSELVKLRWNANQEIRLHHLRVNRGLEIDLIVDDGARLTCIEAKSGETIQPSFVARFDTLRELLAGDARAIDGLLVYGGNERQRRQTCMVVPWDELAAVFAAAS